MVLMEGLDGRLLVISASDPRYAKHFAKLRDGRYVHIAEDLQQTPEFRRIAIDMGDPVPRGPRFYVTEVRLPSGGYADLKSVELPGVLRLSDGSMVTEYVCGNPKGN